LVHLPKQLIAGQPSTFILNVFYKNATIKAIRIDKS
jgi:hypothetical protein